MVKERMDLLELLHKGGMDGDVDFLREALRVLVEGIMDAEVSSRIGAEYGERSPERVTQRNGYRSRAWDTRVACLQYLHTPPKNLKHPRGYWSLLVCHHAIPLTARALKGSTLTVKR